jgi:hypothetical protein
MAALFVFAKTPPAEFEFLFLQGISEHGRHDTDVAFVPKE